MFAKRQLRIMHVLPDWHAIYNCDVAFLQEVNASGL